MSWLLACLVFAQVSVISDDVKYDGKEVTLEGHVSIDHDLAKVSAEQARFRPAEEANKDRLVQNLELHRKVVLSFKDGGILSCWHAYINPESRQGRFTGYLPAERVTYIEGPTTKHPLRKPLALRCIKLDVKMPQTKEKRPDSIVAMGDVELTHGEQFTASAEGAAYMRGDLVTELPPSLMERYSLVADLFHNPRPYDVITLEESIEMEEPKLGTLHNDRQVWVVRTLDQNKAQIDTVSCQGRTILSEGVRTLICDGELLVDRRAGQAFLEGPGQKVAYEDPLGGFLADRMVIDFEWIEGEFTPSKILVSGNVRIHNRDSNVVEDFHVQYALADEVEYLPQEELMTLRALSNGRVLFLDATEDTKVSAKEVVVDRRVGRVQGVGSVRLSLNETEIKQLEEVFEIDSQSE